MKAKQCPENNLSRCPVCLKRPDEIKNQTLGFAFICKARGKYGEHQIQTFFNPERKDAVREWSKLCSGKEIVVEPEPIRH